MISSFMVSILASISVNLSSILVNLSLTSVNPFCVAAASSSTARRISFFGAGSAVASCFYPGRRLGGPLQQNQAMFYRIE